MATASPSTESSIPRETPLSTAQTSPPSSTASSLSHRRSASPLSLSSLPPLTQPSPPSNTLLITQLNSPTIFHPASLSTIRQHINSISPLHSFSPLKSFRRIVCSFYDIDSAIRIRQHLDGAALLGDVRARVYFGEPTPIGEQKRFLERPDAGRLFFISPPPSPPVGWEVREEGAPNKEVVASDLAEALGKLSGKMERKGEGEEVESTEGVEGSVAREEEVESANTPKPLVHGTAASGSGDAMAGGGQGAKSANRNRSRSTAVIYHPEAHGDSPALPAVVVEDTTVDADADDLDEVDLDAAPVSPPETTTAAAAASAAVSDPRESKNIIMAHTSRPPVELMNGI